MNAETMLFHDPVTSSAQVFVQRTGVAGEASARFMISGYLLDCAVATCG